MFVKLTYCGRYAYICIIRHTINYSDIIGPLSFIMYMADLADVAAQYDVTLNAFADDNQLYIHCKPENMQSAVASVQQCVTAIMLLNSGWPRADSDLTWIKPKLIWTGTKHNLSKIPGCGRALVLLKFLNQMTSVFPESNSRRICHSTSTLTLLVLSAFFNYDNYTASDVLLMTTMSLHSFMR